MKKIAMALVFGAATVAFSSQAYAKSCTTDNDCKTCYRCYNNGSTKKCIKRVKGSTDGGVKCTAFTPTQDLKPWDINYFAPRIKRWGQTPAPRATY